MEKLCETANLKKQMMNLLFDKVMFKAASNIPFSTNWENRFAKLLGFYIKGGYSLFRALEIGLRQVKLVLN